MYVVTYTGRATSVEAARQICDVFGHQLSKIHEPGYRRGVCGVDTEDALQVFVHEHWGSRIALSAWFASEEFERARARVAVLLENGSFQTHVYEVLSGGPT